ncbi:MAG: hypothetical protein R2940_08745 [Syntrophotaleaceae bacterium]
MKRLREDLRQGDHLLRDPEASAQAVGLRYMHDGLSGIRRRRHGKGFTYLDQNGQTIRDKLILERIRSLVIPPAWTEVWISPTSDGHLQATGRDERGRKQYLYHPEWAEFRNRVKFSHILQFADALPLLRRRVEADLRQRRPTRERILAAVIRLLEKSLIRVGNEAYRRENDSFGLTTLRRQHVEVTAAEIRFSFRGKSGKWHERSVRDRRVAGVLRKILELPGQELFRYLDDEGELRTVASEDVNEYLQAATGSEFTAKDIRTWHATVGAADALRSLGPAESASQEKKNIAAALRQVAGLLGNRPAASRKYYIHPLILQSYAEGTLLPALDLILEKVEENRPPELDPMETAVKIFLEFRRSM